MQQVVHARLTDAEDTLTKSNDIIIQMRGRVEELMNKVHVLESQCSVMEESVQLSHGALSSDLTNAMHRTEAMAQAITTMGYSVTELERVMQLADNVARQHNGRLNKMEANPVQGNRQAILDPRNLTVDRYDGEKKKFDAWRRSMEVYVNTFYPQAEKILRNIRRCSVPVTEKDIAEAADKGEVDMGSVAWTIENMQRDAGIWLLTKLGPDPKSSVAAAGDQFLNMYCQLNQEYDKLGVETEGQMGADFAKLSALESKTLRDTKKHLKTFENMSKDYREKMGKDVDLSLKRSVLIGILDPDTRMHFVRRRILGDYQEMRQELSNLFCNGLEEGPVPMDVGAVAAAASQPTVNPAPTNADWGCQPCGPATGTYAFGKGGTVFKCWNCDSPDHSASSCPWPLKQEVAERLERMKTKGKGGGKTGKPGNWGSGKPSGWGTNQWNPKGNGKGKGFPGKGKGGKGVNSLTTPENQWQGDPWSDWYDQAARYGYPEAPAPSVNSMRSMNSVVRVRDDSKPVPLKTLTRQPEVEMTNQYAALSEEPEEQAEQERMRLRDTPVSLEPDEWARAHAFVRESVARYEAEYGTLPEPIVPPIATVPIVDRDTGIKSRKIISHEPSTSSKDTSENYPVEANEENTKDETLWKVKVSKSKRSLRPLKSKKKMNAEHIPLDTIRRLDDHAKLMTVKPEEWKMLTLTVDSGAGESVIPKDEADYVPIVEGDRMGCKYEVANGEIIRNQGERRCAVVTKDGGRPKMLNLQVSDVHKALLSVGELVDNGFRVVFDKEWSFIQDKRTGTCDTMDRTVDGFDLVTWVKSADKINDADFARRGR